MVDENVERIRRQNEQPIQVIIGNPPYNANQKNENENNKNREYREIDGRIRDTYVKHSQAQKLKVYDMYARFWRWASDRIGPEGIVAFVTNNSFVNGRGFDGFRKVVAEEFDEIYVLDLGGDYRTGDQGNVFNISVGVAITFMIRRSQAADSNKVSRHAKIFYLKPEQNTVEDKLHYLVSTSFRDMAFSHIQIGKRYTWINQAEHGWDDLLPVATKETKYAKSKAAVEAIFQLYSLGVVTNRDDWVYDAEREALERKVRHFINVYNAETNKHFGNVTRNDVADAVDASIKWTRAVKADLVRGKRYTFDASYVRTALYRPFVKQYLYFASELNEMQYRLREIFPQSNDRNLLVCFTDPGSQKPFMVVATDHVPDLHLAGAASGTQCLPLYRYDAQGNRHDNITDWALAQFTERYGAEPEIQKRDIFHYVYAGTPV